MAAFITSLFSSPWGRRRKMELAVTVVAWAVGSACSNTPAIPSALKGTCTPTEEARTLLKRLSPEAEIFFPGSEGFEDATLRWSSSNEPSVRYVVVPSVDTDVAETVSPPPASTRLPTCWRMIGLTCAVCRSNSPTRGTYPSLPSTVATVQ
jgi:hypothetical protein